MTRVLFIFAVAFSANAQQSMIRTGSSIDFGESPTTRPAQSGTTLPSTCSPGQQYFKTNATPGANLYGCTSQDAWTVQGAAASSIPTGSILLIIAGSCPSGFTEETALNGRTLLGTLAANSNIGTTGGADDITPSGTNNAPGLTMNSYTPAGSNSGGSVSAHAGTAVANHASHTHDYTQVLNHTHTINVNDPGHTHVEQNNSATTGPNVGWGAQDTSTNTASATGYSTQSATTGVTASSVNPSGGVATGTTAGPSATLTHSVTQPDNHTFTQPAFTGNPATLTGSVAAPVFTGTQFDNRSAFARVIFCKKD